MTRISSQALTRTRRGHDRADDHTDWRSTAACVGTEPETFYPNPTDTDGHQKALAICATCPVTTQCAQFADGDNHGIFGGRIPNGWGQPTDLRDHPLNHEAAWNTEDLLRAYARHQMGDRDDEARLASRVYNRIWKRQQRDLSRQEQVA